MRTGVALLVAGGLALFRESLAKPGEAWEFVLIMGVIALIFGPAYGYHVGVLIAQKFFSPLSGMRFSKRNKTIRLRFRSAAYAQAVVVNLQMADK
jgi:hypothetical protein